MSSDTSGTAFPIGSDVDVVVLDVDPENQRIRLSRKAIREGKEQKDARDYADRQTEGQAESFGSLADKLRSAFRSTDE